MKLFRKAVVCRTWRCIIVRQNELEPETLQVEAESKRTAIFELNRVVGSPYKLLRIFPVERF